MSEALDVAKTIDDARVDERSKGHYFRIFGDSYKGHYRGALAGVTVGGLLGVTVAAALCSIPFIGWGIAPLAMTALGGMGAVIGGDGFSAVGAAAASRGSALAEKHARVTDPMYNGNRFIALDDKLMQDGRGYHYEYPPDRDKGKFFFWKSGTVGALITGALGGVLGWAGVIAHMLPAAAALPSLVAIVGATAAPIVAGAFAFGLLGLTLGISRSFFKSIFNHTDALTQGKIHTGRVGLDLGRAQMLGKEDDYELMQHRLKRQTVITELEKQYSKKMFWGAVAGRFRGIMGGMTAGAITGAGVGAVACGIVLGVAALAGLLGSLPISGLALLGVLTGAFSALGAMLGMQIFADAGTQAGAESTARGIDEEFERNRTLKANGITPVAANKAKNHWFNPKAFFTAGLLGAAIGVPLAPVLGAAALGLVHASAVVATGFTAQTIGVSALLSGLIGSTFGFTMNSWRKIGDVTDWVFEKSYFREVEHPKSLGPGKNLSGQISAEDAAKLNERLEAGKGKGKNSTIGTLTTPVGSYAGKEQGQYLRKIAEQKFNTAESSRDVTIN